MESLTSTKTEEVQTMEAQKEAVISALPKEKGWLSSDDQPLYLYQGFWYYKTLIEGILALQTQSHFTPSSSNILISSNPKTGTTWLKALSFSIATRTRFASMENHPLLESNSHRLVPMIEYHIALQNQPLDPNLPLIATHLPYTVLPRSVLDSGCKIVYICRDPKDKFVSHWHFARKLSQNKEVAEFGQAFDLFCSGKLPWGPYWDHILGYWKASLSHPEKVLFLKYEDMMNDTVSNVKRLAEFMGYGFSNEEERDGLIERIVELCSFEKMSNLEVNKSGIGQIKGLVSIPNDSYFRKGQVGDWRNYLSEEMASRIDQITHQKLGAYGLTF